MSGEKFYGCRSLTGGGDGALDSIDGSLLNDADAAIIYYNGDIYFYLLDDDSGASESSPDIISPDSNAGTKRWILQSVYGSGGSFGASIEKTLDASGIVTITNPGVYTVDTYSDAASDSLVKIEGLSEGQEVILKLESASRVVTITKGTYMRMQGDFEMTTIYDNIRLLCEGGNVMSELSRAKNA